MSEKLSKFFSYVLRHQPGSIGLRLDTQGWIEVDELIARSAAAGTRFSREELLQVDLSMDAATALNVGQRHGKPVVLQIDTLRMRDKGLAFFLADNGVWLTDQVAPEFLTLMPD